MSKIDLTKKYQTRDGKPVKLYSIDNGGHYPIHGAVPCEMTPEGWRPSSWTCDGEVFKGHEDDCDLVPVPEKIKIKKIVCFNIYPGGEYTFHEDRHSAEVCADHNRVDCIKHTIDIEVEV